MQLRGRDVIFILSSVLLHLFLSQNEFSQNLNLRELKTIFSYFGEDYQSVVGVSLQWGHTKP